MLNSCNTKQVIVKDVISEEKKVKPPKLYDLTTLQRECNRFMGYTAQKTLDTAQSLYEKKLITYPRTDSQYLTEDMADTVNNVLVIVKELDIFSEKVILSSELNTAPLFDNSKVSDHYAVIPTANIKSYDWLQLSQEERQVLLFIAGKLLISVSPPYSYKTTKIICECVGYDLSATGTTIIDMGFKEVERIVQNKKSKEKENILPEILKGFECEVSKTEITKHDTKPKKSYTEDTLLSSMERAGNSDYSEDTETKGIGTPSTRAGTIEALVRDGYITRKNNIIVPTQTGINLISIAPKELCLPKLTADWEEKLQSIERGDSDPKSFLSEIQIFVASIIENCKKIEIDTTLFPSAKEVLGDCPRCKSNIVHNQKHKNYYCENKACSFALWEDNKLFTSMKKKITKSMVKDFLSKGETFVSSFVSKKTGKTFNATVVMKDKGQYINFDLRFEK